MGECDSLKVEAMLEFLSNKQELEMSNVMIREFLKGSSLIGHLGSGFLRMIF